AGPEHQYAGRPDSTRGLWRFEGTPLPDAAKWLRLSADCRTFIAADAQQSAAYAATTPPGTGIPGEPTRFSRRGRVPASLRRTLPPDPQRLRCLFPRGPAARAARACDQGSSSD